MSLANNFFTGSLPNSIHKLSDMNMLYLDGNYFQGRLPNKIGDMSNLGEFLGFVLCDSFEVSSLFVLQLRLAYTIINSVALSHQIYQGCETSVS